MFVIKEKSSGRSSFDQSNEEINSRKQTPSTSGGDAQKLNQIQNTKCEIPIQIHEGAQKSKQALAKQIENKSLLIQAKTSISILPVLNFLKRMAPQTKLCNIVCLLICKITTLLKSEQRSPLCNNDKKWQSKDHSVDNDGGGDDDGDGCGMEGLLKSV